MNYNVTVNGKVYSVTVEKTGAAGMNVIEQHP